MQYLNWWIRQNSRCEVTRVFKIWKYFLFYSLCWKGKLSSGLYFGRRWICTQIFGWPESKLLQRENTCSGEQTHGGVMGGKKCQTTLMLSKRQQVLGTRGGRRREILEAKSKVWLGAAVRMQTLAVTSGGQTRKGEERCLGWTWEWEQRCFSECLFSWMPSFFSIPKSVIKSSFSLAIN